MKRSRLLRNKYLKNQWAAAWKAFIFLWVLCVSIARMAK